MLRLQFKSFAFLTAFFMLGIGFCHSFTRNHSEVLEAIRATENEEAYISMRNEGRVYLREENLIITNQGMYLCLADRGLWPLNPVILDSQGYYIEEERTIDVLNTCKWCGKKYFITCKNPECPNPYKKK